MWDKKNSERITNGQRSQNLELVHRNEYTLAWIGDKRGWVEREH